MFYSHIVFFRGYFYEQNNNLFVCAFNGCEEMCLRRNWLIINDLVGGGNYCYKLLVKYDLILYFCVIIGILKYLNGL